MAEESLTVPQTGISDYLETSLKRLTENESLALREYYIARQYPLLKPFFDKYQTDIEKAFASGDKDLASVLATTLSEASAELQKYPPQMRNEKPETPLKEKEFDSHIRNVLTARPEIGRITTRVQTATVSGKNRVWIEKLVNNWVKQLPREKQQEASRKLTDAVSRGVISVPPDSHTEVVVKAILNHVPEDELRQIIRKEELSRSLGAISRITDNTRQALSHAVLESASPQIALASIEHDITAVLTTVPETFGAQLPEIAARGKRLGDVAAIAETSPPAGATPYKAIFHALASSGAAPQKALAPFADAFFAVLPEKTQAQILNAVLERSWEKAVSVKWPEKVLGSIVERPFITSIILKGNAAFAEGKNQPHITSPLVNAISDVYSSVFSSPRVVTDYLLLSAADKKRLLHPETAVGAASGSGTAKAISEAELRRLQLSLLSDPKHTYAQQGLLPPPSVPYVASDGTRYFHPGGFGSSVLAPVFTFFGLASLLPSSVRGEGGTGGGTVTVSSPFLRIFVVPLEWLGRSTLGLFSLVTDRFLPWLFAPKLITKIAWYRDLSIILPLLIIIMLILPVLLPFTNGPLLQEAGRSTAYILGTQGADSSLVGIPLPCDPATNPQCSMDACVPDPAKGVTCKWPASGCITQGPFSGAGGSHNGIAANAIDLGTGFFAVPVMAIVDGTIEAVINEYADNTGHIGNKDGGGYGNQIIMSTPQGFWLRYGHLSKDSMVVSPGQQVTAGTAIARTDNNGNSSGPHLHFEIMQGHNPGNVSINSLLGFPVPQCLNDCALQILKQGNTPCVIAN